MISELPVGIIAANSLWLSEHMAGASSISEAEKEVAPYVATYFTFADVEGEPAIVSQSQANQAQASQKASTGSAPGTQVMVLNMEGLINKWTSNYPPFYAGVSELANMLRSGAADPDVRAIVIRADSGGGYVNGTGVFANIVSQVAKIKPVVFSVDGMMASAAYWIGSSGSGIYAEHSTTFFGSIGTLQVHTDLSQMYENMGIKVEYITADGNDLKVVGASTQPLTDKDRNVIKSQLNSIQNEFKRTVTSNRAKLSEDTDTLFSGAVFPAKTAKSLGLIDGIETFEKTVIRAYRDASKKKKADTKAETLTETEPMSILERLANGAPVPELFTRKEAPVAKVEAPAPAPPEAKADGEPTMKDVLAAVLALNTRIDALEQESEASASEEEVEGEVVAEEEVTEEVAEEEVEEEIVAEDEVEEEATEEVEEEIVAEDEVEEEVTEGEVEEVEEVEEELEPVAEVTLADLMASMTAMQNDLKEVKASNASLKEDNENLKTELAESNTKLSEAENKLAKTRKNVRTVKTSKATVRKVEKKEEEKDKTPQFQKGFSTAIAQGTGGNFGSTAWSSN